MVQLFCSVFIVRTKICSGPSSWSLPCMMLTFALSNYAKSEISFLLYCFCTIVTVFCHICGLYKPLISRSFTELSRYSFLTLLIRSWIHKSKQWSPVHFVKFLGFFKDSQTLILNWFEPFFEKYHLFLSGISFFNEDYCVMIIIIWIVGDFSNGHHTSKPCQRIKKERFRLTESMIKSWQLKVLLCIVRAVITAHV